MNENLIFCTSTHWVKYGFATLRFVFLTIIGAVLLYISHKASVDIVKQVTFWAGGLLALYAHHLFFHKLMSESMYDIFITSNRIIYFDDVLFLKNSEHEIPLHRVAGIEVEQKGLMQNTLNFGTLWVDTGGGSASDLKRCVPFVPDPEEFVDKVNTVTSSLNR